MAAVPTFAVEPSPAKSQSPPAEKVLLVDDNHVDRSLVQRLLEVKGFEVIAVGSAGEAIEAFRAGIPDIVLMDVVMPDMSGYEAASVIKEIAGEQFVPLLFFTALPPEEAAARCFEAGADDYIEKPSLPAVLSAKIAALGRLRNLHEAARIQNQELNRHRAHLEHEQEVAIRLFSRLTRLDQISLPNIDFLVSPVSIFNGDILLAAPTPVGGLHVMLGDFTGHGLVAAIGALPVSEIFYGMTAKGFSIDAIASEMNRKLNDVLPTGLFCAAAIIEVEPDYKNLSAWCGGMPAGLILPHDGGAIRTIESSKLPLGIVGAESFDATLESYDMEHGDRLYIYSDGVVEASNDDGDMFGQTRLNEVLRQLPESESGMELIATEVTRFRGDDMQQDDITVVEVLLKPIPVVDQQDGNNEHVGLPPMSWQLSLELGNSALQHSNPLPLLVQCATELQGLQNHRKGIYTILSELYSNALEHGLLDLSSDLKSDPDGFRQYYELRASRLDEMTDGKVSLKLDHEARGSGQALVVTVEHNGIGFDAKDLVKPDVDENVGFSGRGIPMVSRICDSLTYDRGGRKAKAVICWDKDEK